MATSPTLLSAAALTRCKKIAAADSSYSPRAIALIALHGGTTQTEAANRSGLTLNQVKYWLNKFRQVGINAFPTDAESVKAPAVTPEANTKVKSPKKAKKDKAEKSKKTKKSGKNKEEKTKKKIKKKDKGKKKDKKK